MRAQLSNFNQAILNTGSIIVQFVLPQDCLLCGAPSGKAALCLPCHASLPYHPVAACPACAVPTHQGKLCGHCLQHPPTFDRTVAALSYVFPADALMRAMKYANKLAVAHVLAQPLIALAAGQPRPDLLIPMPLHPSRLRERGFNQSAEIAKIAARELGIPLALDACRRTRATTPQAALPWKERVRNMRGAFVCDVDLSGKKVAVLDDVMTTGATLNELSKALRQRGAVEISAWVAARALPQ